MQTIVYFTKEEILDLKNGKEVKMHGTLPNGRRNDFLFKGDFVDEKAKNN